jgi:hypothetical protein
MRKHGNVFPNTLAGSASFSEAAGKTVFRRCLKGGADSESPSETLFRRAQPYHSQGRDSAFSRFLNFSSSSPASFRNVCATEHQRTFWSLSSRTLSRVVLRSRLSPRITPSILPHPLIFDNWPRGLPSSACDRPFSTASAGFPAGLSGIIGLCRALPKTCA